MYLGVLTYPRALKRATSNEQRARLRVGGAKGPKTKYERIYYRRHLTLRTLAATLDAGDDGENGRAARLIGKRRRRRDLSFRGALWEERACPGVRWFFECEST